MLVLRRTCAGHRLGPPAGGAQALETELRGAAEHLAVAHADTQVVDGPAGTAIAEAARRRVDLLVTGSRSYGPVRSVLLGSVSRHLVDHVHCPVLVVPRESGAESHHEPEAVAARA